MACKKVVADGETKDEVDEVTDIKFESEDEDDGNGMLPHQSSEMLDTDIDEEIKLFLKQELISEQDVSEDGVTQKRNTKEKSRNVTDTGNGNLAGIVSECRVTLHPVDDSSEIKQSLQIENNVPEKRIDQTAILHKKRLRDSDVEHGKEIDYGLVIVIESGTNSLDSTEHSDNVSGSKNKTVQNAFDVKAKDVGAEAKSMETTSGRTCLTNRDLSLLWHSYILAVKGIPPKESGVSYIETLLVYISIGSVFAIIGLGGSGRTSGCSLKEDQFLYLFYADRLRLPSCFMLTGCDFLRIGQIP
jgi:hypothetical protein